MESLKYKNDFSQVYKLQKLGNEKMAEVKASVHKGSDSDADDENSADDE